jgi:hypothetical protein
VDVPVPRVFKLSDAVAPFKKQFKVVMFERSRVFSTGILGWYDRAELAAHVFTTLVASREKCFNSGIAASVRRTPELVQVDA